ncbi:11896_t:CDS:2, partial [Gigaspora margarita]
VNEYFKKYNVNDWSYNEFLNFLIAEKYNKDIWIKSLKAITKHYYLQFMEQLTFIKDYILDINRLNNLMKNSEIYFLSNLFPPANVELDEEINECLDNIFSIFKSKETLNAENIFEEVKQKWKLVNLRIKTLKEHQITFIFDT